MPTRHERCAVFEPSVSHQRAKDLMISLTKQNIGHDKENDDQMTCFFTMSSDKMTQFREQRID